MSAETKYFLYDFEANSVDRSTASPVQVAFIKTDADLNPVNSAELLIAPRVDSVIEQDALEVHGINPFYAEAHGISEYQAFKQLKNELMDPNQVQFGYNSMSYDKELLRFGFHRNMLGPYTHEYLNGNSKNDAYSLMMAAYALSPGNIDWPLSEDGITTSFKQESLTKANGISHDNAHTALADTQALLELVTKVKNGKPKLFDFWRRMGNKHNVSNVLYRNDCVWVISPYFGRENHNIAPLCFIGGDRNNPNKAFLVNLAGNVEKLIEVKQEDINLAYELSRDDRGEDLTELIKTIHNMKINESPLVIPHDDMLKLQRDHQNYDLDQVQKNLKLVKQHQGDLLRKVQSASNHQDYKSKTDPDTNLYERFPNDSEVSFSENLQRLPVEKWASFIDNAPSNDIRSRMISVMAREGIPLDEANQVRWLLLASRRVIGRDNDSGRSSLDVKSEAANHLIKQGLDLNNIDAAKEIERLKNTQSITGNSRDANLAAYLFANQQIGYLSVMIENHLKSNAKVTHKVELREVKKTLDTAKPTAF